MFSNPRRRIGYIHAREAKYRQGGEAADSPKMAGQSPWYPRTMWHGQAVHIAGEQRYDDQPYLLSLVPCHLSLVTSPGNNGASHSFSVRLSGFGGATSRAQGFVFVSLLSGRQLLACSICMVEPEHHRGRPTHCYCSDRIALS